MKARITRKADRFLNHLIRESQSEIGFIQMVNPASEKNEWVSSAGISDMPDPEQLYQSLMLDSRFRQAVENKSVHMMEIGNRDAFQGMYGLGVRYGLVIPFYHQSEWTGFVLLGSYFVYPKAVVDRTRSKVASFADFVAENGAVPDPDKEPFKMRLKRYEQSAKALFKHNPDVLWWMDTDGTILSVNAKLGEITGFPKQEVMNRSFDQFIHMKDLDKAIGCFVMAKKGSAQNFEGSLRHRDGHFIEVNITYVPVLVEYKIVGVYGVARDLSERKRAVADLQKSHDFTTMILESITDGFLAVDRNWRITYWNQAIERITKISKEEGVGSVFWDLLPQAVNSVLSAKLHKAMHEQAAVQMEYYSSTFKRWCLMHVYPSQDGLSLFINDITEQKKAEQQIARMKDYDRPTGLPTPELFQARLQQLLKQDPKYRANHAVLSVHLEGMEAAGHLLGFGSGQQLLAEISGRLTACLGDDDIVSRIDGNVFAVVLHNSRRSAVEFTISKIINEFRHPLGFERQKLLLTPVIGISLYPDDGMICDELLLQSEMAMRYAKDEKIPFHFYNDKLNRYKSFALLKELNKAYEQDEFKIFYQPQVDLRTGQIIGFEALLRWEHSEYGMIPPDEFIFLAEESGLIIPIGERVLERACIQAKRWQDLLQRPIKICVNLSPVQLAQPKLAETVGGILEETGLPPETLDLEITESMTMDVVTVMGALEQLKSLGVKISMDDFGKEYSSLHYLKRLPLDTLKIDRAFIQECTMDENDAMLVKTMISMAHHMNLNVVAEGVETKEQLVFLQQNLCDDVQGYLFSRPDAPERLENKLADIESKVGQFGIGTDETNQIWIEEQLRATRQDLEDVIRKQQGMTFKYKEQNGRFIYTLCDGELLYHVDLTPEQVVGHSPEDIFPRDIAEQFVQNYRRAWLGEKRVNYESIWKGIGIMTSLRPILRGGKVIEVIGDCVDITDRKRAETALRESEERYRQLVELSPDIIMVHDGGEILFVNQAGLKAAGDRHDLLSENVYAFLTPEEQGHLKTRSKQLMEGEKLPPAEWKAVDAEGNAHVYEVNAVPIRLKGKTVIQSIARDITERKHQEQLIRDLHAQYRLIAENMSDLIAVYDANWSMVYASPSHELVLGYPVETFYRESLGPYVHPDDLPRVARMYAEMEREKEQKQLVMRYKHRSESWIYLESKVTPVMDDTGNVDRFIIVSRDVTGRHRAEEALRHSEKMAVIGELAAGMVHEFRNPLTVIKGFWQMMKEGRIKPEYFGSIETEFQSLEARISELLLLAQPLNIRMEPIHAGHLLGEIIRLAERQACLRNIQILFEPLPNPVYIAGDRQQLKHVFNNLLANAMDAMPDGGEIRIQVKQEHKERLSISIRDQGCGMQEERLARIGEPFFSTNEKGIGIGMTVSYRIIEEHGGSIKHASEPNQGTTATIHFPVMEGKTSLNGQRED